MAKADKEEMLEEQAMLEQAKSGKAGKAKAMKDNAKDMQADKQLQDRIMKLKDYTSGKSSQL